MRLSILRGWFANFQHLSLHNVFQELDAWMRMQTVLHDRRGGSGRVHSADHYRRTNRFFAEQGLLSFIAAHASANNPHEVNHQQES